MKTIIVIEDGRITLEVDDQRPVIVNETSTIDAAALATLPAIKDLAGTSVELASTPPTPVSKKRRCVVWGDLLPKNVSTRRSICEKVECEVERKKAYARRHYQKKKAAAPTVKKPATSQLEPKENRYCSWCKKWTDHQTEGHDDKKHGGKMWKSVEEGKKKQRERAPIYPVKDTPSRVWCSKCKDYTDHSETNHDKVVGVFLPGYEKSREEIEALRPKDTAPDYQTHENGVFIDPWNCGMCRLADGLCRLHGEMTEEGQKPAISKTPKTEIRR